MKARKLTFMIFLIKGKKISELLQNYILTIIPNYAILLISPKGKITVHIKIHYLRPELIKIRYYLMY